MSGQGLHFGSRKYTNKGLNRLWLWIYALCFPRLIARVGSSYLSYLYLSPCFIPYASFPLIVSCAEQLSQQRCRGIALCTRRQLLPWLVWFAVRMVGSSAY